MFKNIIIGVIFVILFCWVLTIGITKQERVICLKLQAQEQEYPNFYTTEAEKEICKKFGIYFVK